MTELEDWFRDRAETPAAHLKSEIRIEVAHERHLGPTWERAGLVVTLSPAPEFVVELAPGIPKGAQELEYATAAALGFLDVAMVHTPLPVRDVCFRILHLIVDPAESSQMAFRNAGRLAAMKAIETIDRRPEANVP